MRSSCIEHSEVGQCDARLRSGFTIVVDDDDASVETCGVTRSDQIQIQTRSSNLHTESGSSLL
jgi:hypothetical protein